MNKNILACIASLLLLSSCGGGDPYEDTVTFTAEDAEQVSALLDQIESQMDIEDEERQTTDNEDGEPQDIDLNQNTIVDVEDSDAYRFASLRSSGSEDGEKMYRVTNAFLNVRSEPLVRGALVAELEEGDVLRVISFPNAKWAEVMLPGGRTGYVASTYISRLVNDEQLEAIKKEYEGMYEVNFRFLNVRSEPSSSAQKLGELQANELIKPIAFHDKWARIPFEGKEGFIATEYLRPYTPSLIVRQSKYTLPILLYRASDSGLDATLVQHIAYLKSLEKNLMTFGSLTDLLYEQEKHDIRLPANSVIIAITDITADTLNDIASALRASDTKATLFIATGEIGADGIAPQEISALVAEGHDIQSAGHESPDMRAMTNQQIRSEFLESRGILEGLTGKDVITVAYPGGGVNNRITEQALHAGYLFGVTRNTMIEGSFTRSDFLNLPTHSIVPSMSADSLQKLAGM